MLHTQSRFHLFQRDCFRCLDTSWTSVMTWERDLLTCWVLPPPSMLRKSMLTIASVEKTKTGRNAKRNPSLVGNNRTVVFILKLPHNIKTCKKVIKCTNSIRCPSSRWQAFLKTQLVFTCEQVMSKTMWLFFSNQILCLDLKCFQTLLSWRTCLRVCFYSCFQFCL